MQVHVGEREVCAPIGAYVFGGGLGDFTSGLIKWFPIDAFVLFVLHLSILWPIDTEKTPVKRRPA